MKVHCDYYTFGNKLESELRDCGPLPRLLEFVLMEEKLWYIGYECSLCHEKWDFQHRGRQYWG